MRRLSQASDALASTFERLSSGQRINRASDDAAGLSIASKLNADARVFNQGIRNLNDGLSLLNIADGAVENLEGIVIRLRELATQGANGTFNNKQRQALDKEAQALSEEYNRIARSTSFNGRNLFDASFGGLTLQAGYGQLAGTLGGAIGTGSFSERHTYSAGASSNSVAAGDFNGDGIPDLVTADQTGNAVYLFLGRGDGSFAQGQSFTSGTAPRSVTAGDLNGDGLADAVVADSSGDTLSVFFGRADGTLAPRQSYATYGNTRQVGLGDFNGDGISDLLTVPTGGASVGILFGRADGTFASSVSTLLGASLDNDSVKIGDFNGDGVSDFIGTRFQFGLSTALVYEGAQNGTFTLRQLIPVGVTDRPMAVGDLDGDGIEDLVTGATNGLSVDVALGRGDSTFGEFSEYETGLFPRAAAIGDFDGDGHRDIVTADSLVGSVSTLLGRGDGTFAAGRSFAASSLPDSIAVADFDGDGVLDVAAAGTPGGGRLSILMAGTTEGIPSLLPFSLASRQSSRDAMADFARTLDRLTAQRGEIGAFQARLQVAVNSLSSLALTAKEAESRILDADIAHESAELARLTIVQQSAQSVLAQANLEPRLALLLLGTGA